MTTPSDDDLNLFWPFPTIPPEDFYARPLVERQTIERRVAEIMREMLGSAAREQGKPEET